MTTKNTKRPARKTAAKSSRITSSRTGKASTTSRSKQTTAVNDDEDYNTTGSRNMNRGRQPEMAYQSAADNDLTTASQIRSDSQYGYERPSQRDRNTRQFPTHETDHPGDARTYRDDRNDRNDRSDRTYSSARDDRGMRGDRSDWHEFDRRRGDEYDTNRYRPSERDGYGYGHDSGSYDRRSISEYSRQDNDRSYRRDDRRGFDDYRRGYDEYNRDRHDRDERSAFEQGYRNSGREWADDRNYYEDARRGNRYGDSYEGSEYRNGAYDSYHRGSEDRRNGDEWNRQRYSNDEHRNREDRRDWNAYDDRYRRNR